MPVDIQFLETKNVLSMVTSKPIESKVFSLQLNGSLRYIEQDFVHLNHELNQENMMTGVCH